MYIIDKLLEVKSKFHKIENTFQFKYLTLFFLWGQKLKIWALFHEAVAVETLTVTLKYKIPALTIQRYR